MMKINGLSLELIIPPGETIKELLKDNKISKKKLSIKTGYSVKYISEILNGNKDISYNFANSIEQVFGIFSKIF